MELSEFNSHFLSDLLEKVSFENKAIVLSSDFNANLLKYDTERDFSDFLNPMYVNTLLPQITTPSRITAKSATLIDNIFANQFDPSFISGNLTISLSDHLAQFLIMSSFKKTQNVANGSPKYHRDMKNIDTNKDSISTLLKQTGIKNLKLILTMLIPLLNCFLIVSTKFLMNTAPSKKYQILK